MFKGNRKFFLGLAYLVQIGVLSWHLGGDSVGALAALAGTEAGGLMAIVWGNAQEHRAANGG